MNKKDLIKRTVFALVEKNSLFTSVDISQEIKKSGTFIPNREVTSWLKSNFASFVEETKNRTMFTDPNIPHTMANYVTETIAVSSPTAGNTNATLYLPDWATEDYYTDRGQVPLKPEDVKKLSNPVVPKDPMDIKDLMDQDVPLVSIKISSDERIKIPSSITRKLGWGYGTVIDDEKAKLLKTDKPLPRGLRVNKDLRISIPRDVINASNPLAVRFDGHIVTFQKV